MTNNIFFELNDHTYYTDCKLTLMNLIDYFNYNTSLLVLEYNNFICNKDKWNSTFIKNNDKIELVTIVGGG